ncbi:MAG: hypothetical protein NTX26_00250 [Candidatus Parcubacteria bacterium]|nr:hypothetical protein [Candidatus Parcubacteria bacterium]
MDKSEAPVLHRLSEKHCRISFPNDKKKNMILSIEEELGSDVVDIYCSTKHQPSINICLILLKEGFSVRCIGRDEIGGSEMIFDSTVSDFCEFIQNLQKIADDLNSSLYLGSNPLRDYRKQQFLARINTADNRPELIGYLNSQCHTFRVTVFDDILSVGYLKSHIDRKSQRLVIRESRLTDSGRKVSTVYDSFYENPLSK